VFDFSSRSPEWIEHGALGSTAVFERGEWWRLMTALFLHADALT
jgi:membrane associated rhomboid family serine protease